MKKAKTVTPFLQQRIFSIAYQLRFVLILLVLASLLPIGGILIYLSSQAQMQQTKLLQQERSRAAASEINAYLDDLQRKLGYLARVRGLTNLSPTIQRRLLEGLIRHNDAYEMVGILNNSGKVVTAVSPDGQALPTSQSLVDEQTKSPLFLRAFKQQEDYVSPVALNPTTNLPFVVFAVPIRDRQDKVDGVLFARVNLNFLWFVVSQTNVGKTGYTYVVDNRNFLIATAGLSPETFKLQDLSNRPFIRNFTLGTNKPLTVYQGLNNVEVLGAVTGVGSTHWYVVAELPTAEAYAPVRYMLFVMGAALALVTVAAVGVGFVLSRRIVLPLRHLTKAAAKISKGNLNTRVDIPDRNELGVLATTFNKMTAQLRELVDAVEVERNFLSAILEIAGALVVVLDRQGRIVRLNRACERITNYSFNEVKDKYFWDIFLLPETVEKVKLAWEHLQVKSFPNQYEGYWVTKDGRHRLIAWSNTALCDREGAIEYIISTGLDITERKRAEKAMQEAKEAAEIALESFRQAQAQLIQAEKMSSLGQLVAGVAHEINNPVNFIYGNLTHTCEYTRNLLDLLYLYQKHYPSTHPEIQQHAEAIDLDFLAEDLPKMLSSMEVGTDRIRQIVRSLQNFSRLDQAEVKAVDIHEGIDSTLLILQNRLKAKPEHPGIEIVKEYGTLPLVECYPGQLNQVFMNIVVNAIDALESYEEHSCAKAVPSTSGCITIRTEQSSAEMVLVQITDNGPGIPDTVKQQLFNPFFTTKPVGKGTGLGLSISYQIIVEKHGGSIWCVSEPYERTSFWIEIPIQQTQNNYANPQLTLQGEMVV